MFFTTGPQSAGYWSNGANDGSTPTRKVSGSTPLVLMKRFDGVHLEVFSFGDIFFHLKSGFVVYGFANQTAEEFLAAMEEILDPKEQEA